MANPDKFLRLRDYARLERAQKNGAVDGTKFAYDSAKHVVSNVREYFDAHRDGRTYGVRFPLYSFSNLPDGVKVGTVSVSPRGDLRLPSEIEFEDFL